MYEGCGVKMHLCGFMGEDVYRFLGGGQKL